MCCFSAPDEKALIDQNKYNKYKKHKNYKIYHNMYKRPALFFNFF
jgi:hypothetical protein